MLGLVDVCYFSGELMETLSYKYPLPLFISHASLCPRLLVDHFMSVLSVSMLPNDELLKFQFKEVMLNCLSL